MSKEIKRYVPYNMKPGYGNMVEHADGLWVRHADHAEALQQMVPVDALEPTAPNATRYVCGFCFTQDDHGPFTHVLVVRKAKPAWQRGRLNGVGGKVEETDASISAAMYREFDEETRGTVDVDKWVHYHTECIPSGNAQTGKNVEVYFFYSYATRTGMLSDAKTATEDQHEPCEIIAANSMRTDLIYNLPYLIRMALAHSECATHGNELGVNPIPYVPPGVVV